MSNIPDSAVMAYEEMQDSLAEADALYMAGYDVVYALERPCESCGLHEALPGDPDCLACNIAGELISVQRELAGMEAR
jgi:hypothetical protein